MINNKIMKLSEWQDSIWYQATCDCTSPDCDLDIHMSLGKDKEHPFLYINFYHKVAWSERYDKYNWFSRIWRRLTGVIQLLFTGQLEFESDFILQGEEQINSFIEALEEGKKKLKEKPDYKLKTLTDIVKPLIDSGRYDEDRKEWIKEFQLELEEIIKEDN